MSYKIFSSKKELVNHYKNAYNYSNKISFQKRVNKFNTISLGYHEFDKEYIKLEKFTGKCLKFKSKDINTKFSLLVQLDNEKVLINTFLYQPFVFDIHIR